jgi:MYXO-CTERM domain-containing protein
MMTARSLFFAFALTLSVPGVAAADDGGTSTGGSSSDGSCNVLSQMESGDTCGACMTSGGKCTDQLGKDYNYVCTQSSTVEIWCNGPARTQYPGQGCSVSASGAAGAPILALAIAGAIAAFGRRSRRR